MIGTWVWSTVSSASFTKCSVLPFRSVFNASISLRSSSTCSSEQMRLLSAISALAIRPAALMRGQIWNPIISVLLSDFPSISLRSHGERDFGSCLSQSCTIVRFSQVNGIISATVPSAAKSINDSMISKYSFVSDPYTREATPQRSLKAVPEPDNP